VKTGHKNGDSGIEVVVSMILICAENTFIVLRLNRAEELFVYLFSSRVFFSVECDGFGHERMLLYD